MREPTPQVSFDIGLGEWFHDVVFDYDALISYLEEMDVDRDIINNFDIRIKADNALFVDESSGELRTIHAVYTRSNGVITVFPHMVAFDYQRIRNSSTNDANYVAEISERFNSFWSEKYSEFVNHEVAHKMRHVASGLEGNSEHQERTAQELARVAMNQEGYEDDPEEEICNLFAKEGPKNIIKFRIKEQPTGSFVTEHSAAD